MENTEKMEKTEKTDRTQLVFIIDRSGSMSGLECDTVGGFNRVLGENRKLEGECFVTTILFDSDCEILHNALPVQAVRDMQMSDYRPGGCTALLDAMGEAINRMLWQRDPGSVQFVIMTDGEENSSKRYNLKQIRDMVTKLREERNWDFLFLGANIDAIGTAKHMGILADRAVDAFADSDGTSAQYDAVIAGNLEFRMNPSAPCRSASWKESVERDRKRRGK